MKETDPVLVFLLGLLTDKQKGNDMAWSQKRERDRSTEEEGEVSVRLDSEERGPQEALGQGFEGNLAVLALDDLLG